MKNVKFSIYAGGVVASTLAFGAAPALAEKVLNVSYSQDIRSTQPGVDRDGPTDAVLMHVVEGLMGYAEDFSVRPVLAESVETSEDGLTYTFKLRKGVKFHNGEEMTAADVKWSWDRYMDPATGWRCRTAFNGEDGVAVTALDIVDDYTVRYTLAGPSATFLGNLARFDCGSAAVLHSESVDADGDWVKPVSTGPFTYGDIRSGQYIELIKFPDYVASEGEPSGYTGAKVALVDKVRYNILTEAAVKKTAFMAGDLDVAMIEAGDVEEIEGMDGASILTVPTAIWDSFLINVRDPLLSNPALRAAIVHALDRDMIVEVTTEGRGESNPSVVPPMSAFHSDAVNSGPDYDPARSAELLKEAGYNGETIKIITNRRTGGHYDRALIGQSMLAAAGIKAELETIEWGTQIDIYNSGDYQMMAFSYSARLDPALSFEMISGPQDRKVLRTDEAQRMVEEALIVAEKDQRQALIDGLQAEFNAENAAYSIGHRPYFYAVRDEVTGFTGSGTGNEIYWGVDVNR
ncbi:MAG: ABC transporter substrate-binding protein [Cereibacter changlensis]|jgi:peptide/nickel transport system substrate-binding protein